MSAQIIDLAERRRTRRADCLQPWPLILAACIDCWLVGAVVAWRLLFFDPGG